jgi:hypothetical protein
MNKTVLTFKDLAVQLMSQIITIPTATTLLSISSCVRFLDKSSITLEIATCSFHRRGSCGLERQRTFELTPDEKDRSCQEDKKGKGSPRRKQTACA